LEDAPFVLLLLVERLCDSSKQLTARSPPLTLVAELSHGILPDEEESVTAPVSSDTVSLRTSVTASLSNEAGVIDKDATPVPINAAARSPEAEEAEIGMPTDDQKRPSRFKSFLSYPLRRRRWLIPGILSALCIGGTFPLSGALTPGHRCLLTVSD
jgi:hypothetical protein